MIVILDHPSRARGTVAPRELDFPCVPQVGRRFRRRSAITDPKRPAVLIQLSVHLLTSFCEKFALQRKGASPRSIPPMRPLPVSQPIAECHRRNQFPPLLNASWTAASIHRPTARANQKPMQMPNRKLFKIPHGNSLNSPLSQVSPCRLRAGRIRITDAAACLLSPHPHAATMLCCKVFPCH